MKTRSIVGALPFVLVGCMKLGNEPDTPLVPEREAGAESTTASQAVDAGAPIDAAPPTPPVTGVTARSIAVAGARRTFLVYVPATLDPAKPAPLVLVHHGFTMSGEIMLTLTSFQKLAAAEGFVAVFPDGANITPWNVGDDVCGAGTVVTGTADDFAFVDAMIDNVDKEQKVDRDHVFVAGFSMGGYFAHHAACGHGNVFRAAAPHSGGTYAASCASGPKPMLILHGTADPLIAPQCAFEARDKWVKQNGCGEGTDSVKVKGGTCFQQRGCPKEAPVVLCTFDGMGHGWAGGTGVYGGGAQYDDAAAMIWSFFKAR